MVESPRSSHSAAVAEAIGLRASPPTLSVEFELFWHCTVRDIQVTALTGHLLGRSGDHRWVEKRVF